MRNIIEGNRWVVCKTKETYYQPEGRIIIHRNNRLEDVIVMAGPFDTKKEAYEEKKKDLQSIAIT